MIKVGLIGGPCTGKSTIGAELYSICKKNDVNAALVTEFARDEINRGWKFQHPAEQYRLLKHQRIKEDTIPAETLVMITDSPTLLCYYYALVCPSDPLMFPETISDLYSEFITDGKRYDYLFFLNRDFEYSQDGTRLQTKEEADQIAIQVKSLLEMHKIDFIELDSDYDTAMYIFTIIFESWKLKTDGS